MTASLASPPAFDYAMQAFPHSRHALALVVLTHVVCALLLVKLLDAHRSEPRPPLIVEILQPPPEIPEKLVPKKKPLEPKIEEPPLPPEMEPERALLEPPTPAEPRPQFDLPPPPVPAMEVRPEPRQTPQQITVEPHRMPAPVLQARREPVPTPVVTPIPTPAPVPLIEPTAPLRESPMPPRLAPPKETIRDLPPEPIRFAQAPTIPTPTVLEPIRPVERDIAAPEVPRMTPREPPRQVRNEMRAVEVAQPTMPKPAVPESVRAPERDIAAPEASRMAPHEPPRHVRNELQAVEVAPSPTMPKSIVPEPVRTPERDIAAPEAPRMAPREPPRHANNEMLVAEMVQAPLPSPPAAVPRSQVVVLPEPPLDVGGAVAEEIAMGAAMLRANYLRNPKPGYPNLSRRLGEQGTVLLRVFVTAAGNSTQVDLKRSSGYPRLDRAAHDAVRSWKFVPAKREEKAVDVWVVVPIKFSLK